MNAWTALTFDEDDVYWDRFYADFQFQPSYPANGPGILEPVPSITYDISEAWRTLHTRAEFSPIFIDLHIKALAVFCQVTPPGQRLIALDWQHTTYLFDPHAHIDAGDLLTWRTWVLPDGDYSIFLAEDFSFGTFGHPWAETICVFGQPLLDAFETDLPKIFDTPIRHNRIQTRCHGIVLTQVTAPICLPPPQSSPTDAG